MEATYVIENFLVATFSEEETAETTFNMFYLTQHTQNLLFQYAVHIKLLLMKYFKFILSYYISKIQCIFYTYLSAQTSHNLTAQRPQVAHG